ncbi:CD276 antigen-like [Pristis pectinata]|uniref:CD276 antigen-like n=1 Tax=Pristis pectinata TaxID=685728 RepID=UPI00223E811D|nr:CD276 antigen-like [Pristis pectinata]XP_051900773.1 CD276 antigen-like [Pristis pectinata]
MEVFWTLTTLLLVAGTSQSGPLHCLHRRTQLKGFSDHHVALPCSFNWTGTEPLEYMVVWNVAFTHQGRKTMVHGQENRKDVEQDSMFNGRTKLGEAWFVKRNASLRLRRLSPSDEGTYTCQITTMNPHSRKVCAEVALTVQKRSGPHRRSNRTKEDSGLSCGNSTRAENQDRERRLFPRHSSGTRHGPQFLIIAWMSVLLLPYLHTD